MKLCSNEFLQFFDSVPDGISSTEELTGYIAKAITPVADKIGLGKLEIKLNVPASAYEPQIKNSFILLYYYKDGYDNQTSISQNFKTHSGGSLVVYAYPRKDVSWDLDDKPQINFLCHAINMIFSKATLTRLIRYATITDSITGIANTAGLHMFLEIICKQHTQAQYTAFFMNIKNFRYYNQRFGSRNGDAILRRFSQRVNDYMLPDEKFARLGGDNFVAIVKSERRESFQDFMTCVKLHINLGETINTFYLSVRMGIYEVLSTDSSSEIMNNSSIALCIAKNSPHHDYIWFRPDMIERSLHDKEISNKFSSAIDNNEFVVYYQPKIDLRDGSLCGSEALVRWKKDNTIVPPTEFIPVLEREGTICVMDFYVLECVCSQIRSWLQQGIEPVRVSANFSKIHLHNKNLAEDIIAVLKKYDVDSKYIEVEITETCGYEDFDALYDFVKSMKNYGIHTSIDDFGTGYSSLNLLSDLDVDIIKLDKSFIQTSDYPNVHKSDKKHKSTEIVIKTIINMAHELGMQIICEGVETDEQARFLKELNCDMVQGYLYARPLPVEEYENILLKNK